MEQAGSLRSFELRNRISPGRTATAPPRLFRQVACHRGRPPHETTTGCRIPVRKVYKPTKIQLANLCIILRSHKQLLIRSLRSSPAFSMPPHDPTLLFPTTGYLPDCLPLISGRKKHISSSLGQCHGNKHIPSTRHGMNCMSSSCCNTPFGEDIQALDDYTE